MGLGHFGMTGVGEFFEGHSRSPFMSLKAVPVEAPWSLTRVGEDCMPIVEAPSCPNAFLLGCHKAFLHFKFQLGAGAVVGLHIHVPYQSGWIIVPSLLLISLPLDAQPGR